MKGEDPGGVLRRNTHRDRLESTEILIEKVWRKDRT